MKRSSHAGSIAVVLAVGCSQSAAGSDEGRGPPVVDPLAAGPICESGSRAPLVRFSGRECPWELSADGSNVRLRSLAPASAAKVFGGRLPSTCIEQRCELEGADTPLGPMLLLILPAAESEMPAGTWLGAVLGERLYFFDLWEGAGDHAMEGGTRLGPPHALAPHDCNGQLALLVVDRLPGVRDVPPSPALVAREGKLAIQAGELAVEPIGSRNRCESITAIAVP